MEDDIFVECTHCGVRYTISCSEIVISDIQDDPNDMYPKYCSFCGEEIEI